MRFAPYVLAVVLAGSVAGCAQPYYYGSRYSYYGPNYAYVPADTYYPSRSYAYTSDSYYPPRSYAYTSDTYYAPRYTYSNGYYSKWDYYRNYQGSLHPGPERYP